MVPPVAEASDVANSYLPRWHHAGANDQWWAPRSSEKSKRYGGYDYDDHKSQGFISQMLIKHGKLGHPQVSTEISNAAKKSSLSRKILLAILEDTAEGIPESLAVAGIASPKSPQHSPGSAGQLSAILPDKQPFGGILIFRPYSNEFQCIQWGERPAGILILSIWITFLWGTQHVIPHLMAWNTSDYPIKSMEHPLNIHWNPLNIH